MRGVARTIGRLLNVLGIVTAWCTVVPIAAFAILQVAGRRFDIGDTGELPEISIVLMFALVMLLFGKTYVEDGHIRVDVLRRHWTARSRAMIELAGICLVLLPLSAVLTYYGVLGILATPTKADAITWVARGSAVLGAILLALAGTAVGLRAAAFLSDGSNGDGHDGASPF